MLGQAGANAYDPGQHLTFIERRAKDIRRCLGQVADKSLTPGKAVAELGKWIGDSRRHQTGLTFWIQRGEKVDSRVAMRLIHLAGLLDACLGAAVTGLDGDPSSLQLAQQLLLKLDQSLAKKARRPGKA